VNYSNQAKNEQKMCQ